MFWKSKQRQAEKHFLELVKNYDLGNRDAGLELLQMQNDCGEDAMIQKMSKARIELYTEPAQRGDEHAQYWLGNALAFENPTQSLSLMTSLADKGNVEAMRFIALNYSEIGAYGNNPEIEMFWFLKAAEGGDADAMCHAGLEYECNGDSENAYKWYKKSADAGNVEGKICLAKWLRKEMYKIHSDNLGHLTDVLEKLSNMDCESEQLLIDAANQGYTDQKQKATYELGNLYSSNLLNNADYQNALYFYYQSHLFGNEMALNAFNSLSEYKNIRIDSRQIAEWESDFFREDN